MPVENEYLPANHQDAGDEPLYEVSPPPVFGKKVEFGGNKLPATPSNSDPVFVKTTEGTMDFYEALKCLADGAKITRVEWKNDKCYGVLHDSWVCLFTDGKMHTWQVSDGDLIANDWIVL